MNRRILSALLAAILSLGTLVACASDDEGKKPSDTSGSTVTTSGGEATGDVVDENTTTGREGAKDNVPESLKYDGQQVNVVYRNEDWYLKWDCIGTDNSGEVIQDLIWERNRKVEDRFGFTLNILPTQATGAANVASELKNLAFSGSDEYDVIVSTGNTTVQQSLYPYLYELSDVPHLDITQPWWRTSAIESLSFDGEHYRYLMGDNTLNDYLKCGVVYYNKEIYADVTKNDMDALYQTILDGEWTWDVLSELSSSAYIDLNGDGVENVGDQFGLMLPKGYGEASPHMVLACDPALSTKTKDGGIDLSTINDEKNIAIIDLLNKVIHESTGVYQSDKTIDGSPTYFAEDNSLFWTGRLSNAVSATMREMESEYGILPMPKYSAEQEEYITMIHSSATVTCLPKSVSNDRIEMVGAFLEGWSSEAYRTVITTFIESAMKLKYSRDALSGQVIDIVFDNPRLVFEDMYGDNMNNIFSTAVANQVNSGKNQFSSYMAKLLSPAQKTLNTYLEEIVNADG